MRTFNYPSELSVAFSGHRLVPRVLRKQVKNLLVKEILTQNSRIICAITIFINSNIKIWIFMTKGI